MNDTNSLKEKLSSMSKEELIELALQKMAESQEKEVQLNWYREQVAALTKVRMGKSSEITAQNQLNLFNEIEEYYEEPKTEDILEETSGVTEKKKKKRESDYSKLPMKVIHHDIENKTCPECGEKLKELAPEVIQVLKYQPARYVIEKHVIHQYFCPACSEEDECFDVIKADGAPTRLIEGSVASSSVVAGLATNKFVDGTPLYRQELELKRKGVPLSRQNMSNWLMRCSEDYLEPLFNVMHEDFKKNVEIKHMDETTLTVLEDNREENRSTSYEWLGVSGKCEEKQMALYFYHNSREYEYAQEILGKDSFGYVNSDGYEAYHKIRGVINVGCWAHARRKVNEAMEVNSIHKQVQKLKKDEQIKLVDQNPGYKHILHVMNLINRLFKLENEYQEQGYQPEKIKEQREKEAKPILSELLTYIKGIEKDYAPKSKMGVAITYIKNQWEYLNNYLLDGRLEISNNKAERLVKPFVQARKNFLFSNTKLGAKASSIYFSLIQSAILNELDPYKYLVYVLDRLSNEGLRDEVLNEILPYSKSLPSVLYAKNHSR